MLSFFESKKRAREEATDKELHAEAGVEVKHATKTPTATTLDITICNFATAMQLATAEKEFDHVISISSPPRNTDRSINFSERARRVIGHLSKSVSYYQFYDKSGRTTQRNRLAVRRAVADIAAHARTLNDGARVLIHCSHGICRSPAAAMIVLRVCEKLSWEQARQRVLALRPPARPYEEMIELAKELGL